MIADAADPPRRAEGAPGAGERVPRPAGRGEELPVGVPLARVGDDWVPAPAATPLAIDSWRVLDGAVRRLDLHVERFVRACRSVGFDDAHMVRGAVADAVARTPPRGDFFPRVELVAGPGRPLLRFVVRPSPPTTRRVRVWTAGVSRATNLPLKGADLPYLAACRDAARERGADEAILLDGSMCVLEGSTTTPVWWHGDVLHTPACPGVLDSVTLRVVRDLAAADGVPVRAVDARPADLAGAELWVVNALHGIRGVDAWVGEGTVLAVPKRCDDWQRRLDALRETVVPPR